MSAKNARKPRVLHAPQPMTADEANAILERADAAVKALRQLTSEANGTRGDLEHSLREARKDAVAQLRAYMSSELTEALAELHGSMARNKAEIINSANEVATTLDKNKAAIQRAYNRYRTHMTEQFMALTAIKTTEDALEYLAKAFVGHMCLALAAMVDDTPVRPSVILKTIGAVADQGALAQLAAVLDTT